MNKDLDTLIKIVEQQEKRKSQCINLIASENIISNRVRQLQSSLLSNRYILDDFPNNKGLFKIKEKLKKHLSKMFNAKYVNISSLSGMSCMNIIISSLTHNRDNIYILKPIDGGHASTEKICKINNLNVNYLPYDYKKYKFKIKEVKKAFIKNRPKLIYLDNTIISFYSPINELKKISHEYSAPIVYDGSHVLGLIAGKSFPNPLNIGADILSGSTHKTFFGSQKGIILSNNKYLINKINLLSDDSISSIHTGSVLALYMSVIEMEKFGVNYANQVVKNAKALGENLSSLGIIIPTANVGITETHQVWIDTCKLDPIKISKLLADCNINTNYIRIPAIQRIGLRLGTAEVTRLGMKESEMKQIAEFIFEAITHPKDKIKIKKNVINFISKYKKIHYTLDNYERNSKQKDNILSKQQFCMHKCQITTKNINYENFARQYLKDVFEKIPQFNGMILRGGVGRGIADNLSDIDFTCIFDYSNIDEIIKKYNLKKGMHLHNGIMFSGRYISLKSFDNDIWSPKMKHAYSYIKQIKCVKEIKEIIKRKTIISKSEQKTKIISNIIELGEICKIFNEYHGFKMFSEIYKQYLRKEFISANIEIDQAIKYLKNIIFDLNKIHYPEDKSYYIKFFSNLPKQPDNFDEDINLVLQMPRDNNSFKKRLFLLIKISKKVLTYVEKSINLPNDIYKFYLKQ